MGLNPIGNSNWAQETTDLVERYVGLVRDKATNKVSGIVRVVAYGLIVLMAAIIAGVVGLIIFTRLVQRLSTTLFGFEHARAVWTSYVLIGIMFTAAGLFMFRSARKPSAT